MFGFGKNRLLTDIYSTIVEQFEDAIVAIDAHHNIILFNEGAQRIFGYAADEVINRPLTILMPEPHRSQHAHYIGAYLRTREAKIIGKGANECRAVTASHHVRFADELIQSARAVGLLAEAGVPGA